MRCSLNFRESCAKSRSAETSKKDRRPAMIDLATCILQHSSALIRQFKHAMFDAIRVRVPASC